MFERKCTVNWRNTKYLLLLLKSFHWKIVHGIFIAVNYQFNDLGQIFRSTILNKFSRNIKINWYLGFFQHYWENVIPKTSPRDESLKPYIEACLDLSWLSAICDPPIDYSFSPHNLDDYRGYTQNGDTVDFFFVWPAMYLHQYGPLLYQGVVQFKPTSKGKS